MYHMNKKGISLFQLFIKTDEQTNVSQLFIIITDKCKVSVKRELGENLETVLGTKEKEFSTLFLFYMITRP